MNLWTVQRSASAVPVSTCVTDRESFEALFRAEYPRLVRELRLILRDWAVAEEVASEAFVACWRSWPQVATYDRPGAWVRRVALRQAGRSRWRRGRRAAAEAAHPAPADRDPTLDLDLLDALGRLTEPQRVAVVLHHLGGWSAAEVGEVLGCAEATVRSHLLRGRQRLAAVLDDPRDPLEVSDADQR